MQALCFTKIEEDTMKKLILALLIIIPINSNAFDFHGIKSGMNNEQVSSIIKQLGASQDKYNQVDLLSGDVKALKGIKKSPILISFEYNDKDELYKMQINYRGDLSYPSGLGLKLALEQLFKVDVKETSIDIGYSIKVASLVIVLLDDVIFTSTINRYKKKYISEL